MTRPSPRPWAGPRPTSCGRWASPSATRPSVTSPSSRATSAWARAPSARTPSTWDGTPPPSRGDCRREAWPPRSSTSRGSGPWWSTRITASGRSRPPWTFSSRASWCRSGRAIAAGAHMVMSGHVALPAVTGDDALPATVSRRVMDGLLRGRLGFEGVSITDAMDMKAVAQGSAGIVDSIMALRAGVDLLLLTPDRAAQRRLEAGLRQAALRGLLPAAGMRAALRRIHRLRRWLAAFEPPDRGVVHGEVHRALARRAAGAAVTLVRDDASLLPMRPAAWRARGRHHPPAPRPDARRLVLGRGARAGRCGAPPPRRCPRHPRQPRPRCRRDRGSAGRPWPGPAAPSWRPWPRMPRRARPGWWRPSSPAARRRSRWPCARPTTWLPTRARRRTSARTPSCRPASERWPTPSSEASPSAAGCRWPSRGSILGGTALEVPAWA